MQRIPGLSLVPFTAVWLAAPVLLRSAAPGRVEALVSSGGGMPMLAELLRMLDPSATRDSGVLPKD